MNTKGKIAIKESKTRISSADLMRMAGFSAMLAGLSIVVLGMFHPANEPAYVTTPTWIIVHIFATSLGFFGVLGLAGLYARQVEKAGWLGLIGFLLFSVWMTLVGFFSFIEAALMPQLASEFPPFVTGFLGMLNGIPSEVNLGVMPTMWNISTPDVNPWLPAVCHRYVPRRDPAALGSRFSCPRDLDDPGGCTSPNRAPGKNHHDPDGVGHGCGWDTRFSPNAVRNPRKPCSI
jgi:hypothetical protein